MADRALSSAPANAVLQCAAGSFACRVHRPCSGSRRSGIAGVGRHADLRLLDDVVVRTDAAFEIIAGVIARPVQRVQLPELFQRAAVGVKVEISTDHGGRRLEILPHPIEIDVVGVDAVFIRAAIVDQQVDAALSQREGGVVRCRNVKGSPTFRADGRYSPYKAR